MLLLSSKKFHVALVLVIGVLIYANSLDVPFYFDDFLQIINVPLVKNLSYFINPDAARAYPGYGGFVSRYFGYFTFALNYSFGGLNVTGYHLVNLAIHLAASLLVYSLVCLTFRTPRTLKGSTPGQAAAGSGFIALLAALLFVSHPVQTQAVTYLVQRFASLAAMLYLLSLTSYVRARLVQVDRGVRSPAAIGWMAAALVSALLALKTKETSYTLPLALLLYELLFFDARWKRKALPLLLGVFALTAAAAGGILAASGLPLAELASRLDKMARLQTDMPRWDYFATQSEVILTYLRLLVFPAWQQLDYDFPISHTFLDADVVISCSLLFAFFSAGVYLLNLSRREGAWYDYASGRLRLMAFGIFWFFLTLSIESSVIPIVDVIFEHRLYLPSAGLFMAVAAAVSLAGERGGVLPGWPKPPVLAAVAGVILLLAGATVARNQVWRDEVVFWQDNADKSPLKARVFLNLGRAQERKRDLAGAEKSYRTASRLWPEQTDSAINLGLLYTQTGRPAEALAQFKAALTVDPQLAEAHNNIGKIYGSQGQLDEAVQEFLQAVRLRPTMAEAYNNIGYLQALKKDYHAALAAYQKCLSLDPDYELAYVNRGIALLAIGRNVEALADFRRALKINPSDARAAAQLQRSGSGR